MGDELNCSFCGKSSQDVGKMAAGLDAYICDECVGACAETVKDKGEAARMAADASSQRLECLRLAMSRDFIDPVAVAREFYKFVQSGAPAPSEAGDA
ncbi:MAG: ClpX C4-type zinc finger protein [Sphingomonas sp.]|nr:ClpX C4-type zinc finger protein [Sphingomonas sp.]MDX3884059.1 ClpX C4-type zinc finger protein [Sphingomonas sp.]